MPVQVASILIPKSAAKWPLVEDIYIKGGLRVVADAAARDAIYTDSMAKLGLKNGQIVVTADNNKLWQYVGSGTWTELKLGPKFFNFDQTTASDTWLIPHNMNTKYFTYSVFDDGGFAILPSECKIVDVNNLVLYFAMPVIGFASFNFNV